MPYRFFLIPVRDGGAAAAELNGFLRGHRVLSVDRRWVDLGMESYWSFCVDYLDTGQAASEGPPRSAGPGGRNRIDYREVLSPEEFALFVKLRTLRKEIAQGEAVPVYTVFTNEQLAQMVRGGATSRADLEAIAGVGDGRIQKYAERFLGCIHRHREVADEASGTTDGTGP